MRSPFGLCDRCEHQQLIGNTRGSTFSRCGLSRRDDDRFPRYPRMPVERCRGFSERPPGTPAAADAGERDA